MLLDIPYQSQKPYEVNEPGQRKWCGMACLYMVLTYYLKENAPSVDALIEKYGFSFAQSGFEHKDLINIAREFGLRGFRKSWWAKPGVNTLLEKFKNEGENESDINDWLEINLNESFYTLRQLIDKKIPVILSVTKEFSPSESTHLVVLVGNDEDNFILHDPLEKEANFKISKEEFKKYWLRQAIVILNREFGE